MNKLIFVVLCCFLLCFALVIHLECTQPTDTNSRLQFDPLPQPIATEEPPDATLPLPTIAGLNGAPLGSDGSPQGGMPDPGKDVRDLDSRYPFDQQKGSFPRDFLEDPSFLCSVLLPSSDQNPFNHELQIYEKKQAEVEGSHIRLTADRDGDTYRSGMVKSSISFQYCDLTLRIHTLQQPGLLPAIWMLPDSGVTFPEVDLYEAPGNSEGLLFSVLHYFRENRQQRSYAYTALKEGTQELRLLWTEDQMSWFVDGRELMTLTENIPQEPMYLIFNLAVGGDWPGAPTSETCFPSVFHVEVLDFHPENVQIR